jgi:hypothetical protein
MQMRSSLSHPTPNQIDAPSTAGSSDHGNAPSFLSKASGRRDAAVGGYGARSSRNLRSILERGFMRMNEAHDRIRTKVLATHSHIR